MSHPSLSPAQSERLEMLIEECSEIQKAACKILRHGYQSYDPTETMAGPGQNTDDLENEILDLHSVISMMANNKDIETPGVMTYLTARVERKMKYTHHQGDTHDSNPSR